MSLGKQVLCRSRSLREDGEDKARWEQGGQ